MVERVVVFAIDVQRYSFSNSSNVCFIGRCIFARSCPDARMDSFHRSTCYSYESRPTTSYRFTSLSVHSRLSLCCRQAWPHQRFESRKNCNQTVASALELWSKLLTASALWENPLAVLQWSEAIRSSWASAEHFRSARIKIWGRYHGGRRPSSDDSFHSSAVIPPSALDKPSIMKCYHRWWTCSHTSSRRSPTMVTLHDARFVEC